MHACVRRGGAFPEHMERHRKDHLRGGGGNGTRDAPPFLPVAAQKQRAHEEQDGERIGRASEQPRDDAADPVPDHALIHRHADGDQHRARREDQRGDLREKGVLPGLRRGSRRRIFPGGFRAGFSLLRGGSGLFCLFFLSIWHVLSFESIVCPSNLSSPLPAAGQRDPLPGGGDTKPIYSIS